jgi:hypothetical protein
MEISNTLFEKSNLYEMATLKKRRSGLPVNIYLDDSGSYIAGGHAPRIKFQPNKNDSSDTRTMIPMTISDNPEIPIDYKSQLDGITEKDISEIKNFVISNKSNLLRLCNKDDDYDIQDFLNDIIF